MDKISIDNANEPIETEETLPEIIEEQVSEDVILEQNSEEIDDLATDENLDTKNDELINQQPETVKPVKPRERVRNKKKKYSIKKIVTSIVLLLIIGCITFFAYKGLQLY